MFLKIKMQNTFLEYPAFNYFNFNRLNSTDYVTNH